MAFINNINEDDEEKYSGIKQQLAGQSGQIGTSSVTAQQAHDAPVGTVASQSNAKPEPSVSPEREEFARARVSEKPETRMVSRQTVRLEPNPNPTPSEEPDWSNMITCKGPADWSNMITCKGPADLAKKGWYFETPGSGSGWGYDNGTGQDGYPGRWRPPRHPGFGWRPPWFGGGKPGYGIRPPGHPWRPPPEL